MEKKKWADIPSLEELVVDWDYQPKNPQGKRAFVRMSDKDIARMLGCQSVLVKVATADATIAGSLRDICEGGLAVNLKEELAENQTIKVGLLLGEEKIISRALVRHVQQRDREYIAGIMFVDLGVAAKKYISGMYASKILHHTL
jgi:hypothetical protein